MAEQNIDVAILDPRHFDQDYEPRRPRIAQILNSVIRQALTPSQAATELDEWVVNEASPRYCELQHRELTEEEKGDLFLLGPNPSRHVAMLMSYIA